MPEHLNEIKRFFNQTSPIFLMTCKHNLIEIGPHVQQTCEVLLI